MKSFIKTIRLLNAGFLLGIAFTMWLMGEEENKKKEASIDSAENNSSKFDDIYNHYKAKQNA